SLRTSCLFFSSRRRHTRFSRDWSSDVCSSDLGPVEFVKEQGIFVTVVDRGLAKEGIEDVYVAGNNAALGRVSAEYIAERLGGKGKIVILRGIPTVIDNERFDAFMEVIEKTDIEVLDWAYAYWNSDDGFEVMQDFLVRF